MKTRTKGIAMLPAIFAVGVITVASAANVRTYILNGYSFGGISGVNTDELAAKLKDQAGARVTREDIDVDGAILAKELHARHIQGRLFTSLAERHGRVWVIFDLMGAGGPVRSIWAVGQHLEAQSFEGASAISPSDLAAATGLKVGDALSPEKIDAARQAIVARYAKAAPREAVSVRGRIQTRGNGELTLTWIITEK